MTLSRTNNILFTAILIINLYIIGAPLLPQITFWWDSHHSSQQQQLRQFISQSKSDSKQQETSTKVTGPNRIIIPSILLNQATIEAPESAWFNALYKGIWRWPGASTPNKGGNTVFLSHRFSYTGPRGAFYFLNKVQIGDQIGVVWNDKLYTYTVVSSQTVPPNDTAIENNTTDSQITLFTCTPLWHPVDRLVVVATLKGVS